MKNSIKRKLEESYQHIKPYLNEEEILQSMCKCCDEYAGEEHDYSECRNRPCFIMFLGYEYMCWCDSWEG